MNKIPVLLPILLLVLICLSCGGSDDANKYCIKKGEFLASLTETGELQAVNARLVRIPYIGWRYGDQIKITGLVEHGTIVSEGDSVGKFDEAGIIKFQREKENELEIAKADLNKLQAQHYFQKKELDTELRSAEATFNLQKLQLTKSQFESEKMRLVAQYKFKRDSINFEQIIQRIKRNRIIIENELKIQELKLFQIRNDLDKSKDALKLTTLCSPNAGMVELRKNYRTGQMIKVGDELWQGYQIANIPDLSKMKVLSCVHESDIGKIKVDDFVITRLDAYPKVAFKGKIIEIGKLSRNKERNSKIKVFDIVILLDTTDPILKPGMTVSCEIQYADYDEVYYIENECIIRENGRYYLYFNNGDKISVNIGERNTKFSIISGDFAEGMKALPLDQIGTI